MIFHIYAQEKLLAEAARDGRFTVEAAHGSNPEDQSNAAAVAALATVKEAVAFAHSCHDAAETIFRSMSDEDVARPVESFMGTYPAWQFFLFAYDEHWHHRGPAVCVSAAARERQPPEFSYELLSRSDRADTEEIVCV